MSVSLNTTAGPSVVNSTFMGAPELTESPKPSTSAGSLISSDQDIFERPVSTVALAPLAESTTKPSNTQSVASPVQVTYGALVAAGYSAALIASFIFVPFVGLGLALSAIPLFFLAAKGWNALSPAQV